MTFNDYLDHYLKFPDLLYFAAISFGVVFLAHIVIAIAALVTSSHRGDGDKRAVYTREFERHAHRYYELTFACASLLLFVGVYFLIDMNYFDFSPKAWDFWLKYQDFILLGFLIVSILLVSVIDHIFVPVKALDGSERATLRMMSMIFMMVVFAVIKFGDENDNYDTIVMYFLTMIVGRFVYVDATFKDFGRSMKELFKTLPLLLLVLLVAGGLAFYGFKTGYLLRKNGVVLSMFIAHFFAIIEIFILSGTKLCLVIARRIFAGKNNSVPV